MTKEEEKLRLKSVSWCFANDIKAYCVPTKETYPDNILVNGKKKRSIINFVKIVVEVDGSKKVGREQFKQNSKELIEKVAEIYLYYYSKANTK